MISELLVQMLLEQTRMAINQAEKQKSVDLKCLNSKQNETSWSVLECLEDLNLYGDFYLSQIECKIENSNAKADLEFKSGFLGNYFAKSMLLKEKLNKMKTFKKY